MKFLSIENVGKLGSKIQKIVNKNTKFFSFFSRNLFTKTRNCCEKWPFNAFLSFVFELSFIFPNRPTDFFEPQIRRNPDFRIFTDQMGPDKSSGRKSRK